LVKKKKSVSKNLIINIIIKEDKIFNPLLV